jgi:hypothetical protein
MYHLRSQIFTGEQPGDYITLESGPRLVISGNGSVLIRTADPSHEGHYTCQASNGIGSGLSKVIFLRVNGEYILDHSREVCNYRCHFYTYSVLVIFEETFRVGHVLFFCQIRSTKFVYFESKIKSAFIFLDLPQYYQCPFSVPLEHSHLL